MGGNTACVVVEIAGRPPIICDLGTGLRFFGSEWLARTDVPIEATALVSHLHWDHVQGLPFFIPLHQPGSKLHVIAPRQELGLEEAFEQFMSPPYFPIRLADLAGTVTFAEATVHPIDLDGVKVIAGSVPHIGPTLGFRIEANGASLAYVPDHQQPLDGSRSFADSVLELCRDVDVLIHDAQFTDEEFAERSSWGHCTIDYAYELAVAAGVSTLVLFHHDPGHSDDMLDEVVVRLSQRSAETGGPVVVCGREGLNMSVSHLAEVVL